MPSPVRRSARGQPPTASSTSSLSSRQDRSTRVNQNQKSATPRSLSSEEASEPPVARRSQRQPALKDDSSSKAPDLTEDNDEEAIDEEEITRCICGHQEYPGPPLSEAFAGIFDAQSEDAGGLFILCDGCSVWQHGGCVGIVEESQSPDKYFCEECQPKKHAVHTDSRGQRYSLYLPLHPKAHRKGSMSKSDEKAKRERENTASRASVDPSTGKRRGTMRSKEHDEEEQQLKRAIEESKREVEAPGVNSRRIGKRGRDDSSEDIKHEVKRQRRVSESIPSIDRIASIEDDSDDTATAPVSKLKKAKADAALSARQAEQKEKDQERDKARAEAAGRRLERARSRRNDEVDAAEETTPKPSTNSRTSPPAPLSQPPSPPATERPLAKRGPGKKPTKKLGNNQYTRKRLEEAASSPHGRKRNNHVPGSGDDASETAVNGDSNGNNNGTGKQSPGATGANEVSNGNGKGKFGRGKKGAMVNGNGVRGQVEEVERTFTNMHLALANMSTYISRQHEVDNKTSAAVKERSPLSASSNGVIADQLPPMSAVSESSAGDRRFDELSCTEMATELQKGITEWQKQWGHLANGLPT